MAYTSMLFALGFDKFFFGQTPGATSIIGSTMILGSAIYMAMQRDKGSAQGNGHGDGAEVGQNRDEEQGLMGQDQEDESIEGAIEMHRVDETSEPECR